MQKQSVTYYHHLHHIAIVIHHHHHYADCQLLELRPMYKITYDEIDTIQRNTYSDWSPICAAVYWLHMFSLVTFTFVHIFMYDVRAVQINWSIRKIYYVLFVAHNSWNTICTVCELWTFYWIHSNKVSFSMLLRHAENEERKKIVCLQINGCENNLFVCKFITLSAFIFLHYSTFEFPWKCLYGPMAERKCQRPNRKHVAFVFFCQVSSGV